jgi:hypothetical protein
LQHGEQWGLPGDQPIFGADFDGDRIADPAVKRNPGDYFVLPSTGNCPYPMVPIAFTKGCYWSSGWANSDVPLPGDYDGDGKTDIAARSTAGGIHFIPSSGGCPANPPSKFSSTTYNGVAGCVGSITAGGSGDKPLVGDYDGDGKTDISWHSPSFVQIWTYPSAGGSCPNHFLAAGGACYSGGFASGDIPVTEDFDADGKTEAMWRTSSTAKFNTWGVSSSSGAVCPPNFTSGGGYCSMTFGASSDVPLGKQFTSDGKAEPTLVGPSSFIWVANSTSGGLISTIWSLVSSPTYTTQWGLPGDKLEGLR